MKHYKKYMSNVNIEVISQKKYKDTHLYKASVNIEKYDESSDEYHTIDASYIVKYLKFYNSTTNVLHPTLMEAFINRRLKSQYLATADYVYLEMGVISLFYKEAKCNMNNFGNVTFTTLKQWIKDIIKGVAYLHSKRIIHGNICPQNVLLYDDGAKISNFSSSALILGSGNQNFGIKMFKHDYRPLEVWENTEWGLSADIWALGCTLYEIIYGQKLFPPRNSDSEYLKQLYLWKDSMKEDLFALEFSDEWNNDMYIEINRLIISMLNPNPDKRPNIFEILQSSFFEGNSILSSSPDSVCYYSILDRCNKVSQRRYTLNDFQNKTHCLRIYEYLRLLNSDNEIILLIMSIYEDHVDIPQIDKELLRTITNIVYLLTYKKLPSITIVNRDKVNDILIFSDRVDFSYINFNKFFGIIT